MHATAELLYLSSHNNMENMEIYKDMQSIWRMSFFCTIGKFCELPMVQKTDLRRMRTCPLCPVIAKSILL